MSKKTLNFFFSIVIAKSIIFYSIIFFTIDNPNPLPSILSSFAFSPLVKGSHRLSVLSKLPFMSFSTTILFSSLYTLIISLLGVYFIALLTIFSTSIFNIFSSQLIFDSKISISHSISFSSSKISYFSILSFKILLKLTSFIFNLIPGEESLEIVNKFPTKSFI